MSFFESFYKECAVIALLLFCFLVFFYLPSNILFNLSFVLTSILLFCFSVLTFSIKLKVKTILQLIKPALISIIISSCCLWLTLKLSFKEINHPPGYKNSRFEYATGGFPFETFIYPCCAFGNDQPPTEQWNLFFVNFGIYYIFCLLIILLLYKLEYNKLFSFQLLTILLLLINLIGILYVQLRFD